MPSVDALGNFYIALRGHSLLSLSNYITALVGQDSSRKLSSPEEGTKFPCSSNSSCGGCPLYIATRSGLPLKRVPAWPFSSETILRDDLTYTGENLARERPIPERAGECPCGRKLASREELTLYGLAYALQVQCLHVILASASFAVGATQVSLLPPLC
jgi:hypothetical protein